MGLHLGGTFFFGGWETQFSEGKTLPRGVGGNPSASWPSIGCPELHYIEVDLLPVLGNHKGLALLKLNHRFHQDSLSTKKLT